MEEQQKKTTEEVPQSEPQPEIQTMEEEPAKTPTEQPRKSSWSGWGWNILETAKSKSASVLEAVKKDLDELTTVVKSEATAASSALGLNQPESTVGQVKRSFSTFLDQVTDVFAPNYVDDDESEAVMITKDGLVALSGFQKHLAELQVNDATYLQAPVDELVAQYQRWLEVVSQEQFTEPALTKHLNSSQILNEKYTELVPTKISHMEFWKRYLFKKALLEDALANAEQAERRAQQELTSEKPQVPEKVIIQTEQPKKGADGESSLDWLDKEISAASLELSEEDQARLLAEYEAEIKAREEEDKKNASFKKPSITEEKTTNPAPATKSTGATRKANAKQIKTKGSSVKTKGNKEMKFEKDHFKKEETTSSTSDESWEKDFDLNSA